VPPGSKQTSDDNFTISGCFSSSRSISAAISDVRAMTCRGGLELHERLGDVGERHHLAADPR
jgi:hypothetical protein